ncbi:Fic family protein [Halogeometricum borinquense]|uniref:Fic family protein n=1 Tax=Halogeometricum borinquense TaxID=60847 RepID=A0A482TGN0_9EURY|nr:Fic family protein [Halogeometricum borinquense]RYJ19608.1 Fic family protein [Halogeometricum borinquense]
MRTKKLPEEAPGTYVEYHPRPYYSPNPLPPEPKIGLPDETHDLVADAAYQIGRVDGISSTVDFAAVLYTTLIRIEAVESARIEGAEVDYQDVAAFHTKHEDSADAEAQSKDLREALNYEEALLYGIDHVGGGGKITLDLLKHLHEMLLDDVRNEGDVVGAFRDHMVQLNSPNPAKDPFIPPAMSSLDDLMSSLVEYVGMDGEYHPLVDAAIIHYFFETVHPFSDGNGRLGRLVIILYLVDQGYIESPYIYPSAYFNRHKVEYVEKMRAVSEQGEWVEWIDFFLEALRSQAEESYDRTWALKELQTKYETNYAGNTSTDRFVRKLLEIPYFTANDIVRELDVSRGTAYNVIENLEDSGLIEEVTGAEWGQEYKAVEVFDVFE